MTSEHAWGEWLKPYLRNRQNKHRHHRRIVTAVGPHKTSIRIRAGGPLTSSARVVCGPCNSGWLSRIQKRAKPYLIPLIEGRETLIGEKAQAAIATWATMATMTGEYTLNRLAAIGVMQSDRTTLMGTSAPIPGWRIWVGTYRRAFWNAHYVHTSMPIEAEGDVVIPNVEEPDAPLTNTQWSTVMIGALYIHVASSANSADLIAEWDWPTTPRAKRLLAQIWPPKETVIKWPFQSMTDKDAQEFSIAHFRRLQEIGRAAAAARR
jgi:hypothetical protein